MVTKKKAAEQKAKAEGKDKVAAAAKNLLEKDSAKTCTDKRCPKHGSISVRGRSFEGEVTRKRPGTVKISWLRIKQYPKYERVAKVKSGVFAHLPECMVTDIRIGDKVKVTECRPLSKTKHFVVVSKIK